VTIDCAVGDGVIAVQIQNVTEPSMRYFWFVVIIATLVAIYLLDWFEETESCSPRADSAALSAPAFDQYPSAFRDTGFTIEIYEETRNWRSLLTNALGALVASEDAVRKEVESPRAEWLLAWARTRPAELEHSRRVCFCVQRSV
jgi:hypothetical protein